MVKLVLTNTDNSNTGSVEQTLVWVTSVPAITNVDAAGDIASTPYLNAADRSSTNPLIANVTGSGQTTVEYTVTSSGTTCSAATGYGSSVPLSNDSQVTTDGAYKVCVKFTDEAGNPPAYDDSVTLGRYRITK